MKHLTLTFAEKMTLFFIGFSIVILAGIRFFEYLYKIGVINPYLAN